jgi:hypothetical protein
VARDSRFRSFRLTGEIMDEEKLFAYTDELMMEAREDQRQFIRRMEEEGFDKEDLCAEIYLCIGQKNIDWSRLFILAVLGVQLNDKY